MTRQLSAIAVAAAAVAVLTGGAARAETYTVLDHPAAACHLSVTAVESWGETSAHLPQACTYGER